MKKFFKISRWILCALLVIGLVLAILCQVGVLSDPNGIVLYVDMGLLIINIAFSFGDKNDEK